MYMNYNGQYAYRNTAFVFLEKVTIVVHSGDQMNPKKFVQNSKNQMRLSFMCHFLIQVKYIKRHRYRHRYNVVTIQFVKIMIESMIQRNDHILICKLSSLYQSITNQFNIPNEIIP